jgi:hypothetical protein
MVGSAGACSGASFSLLKPARETASVTIGEWEIEYIVWWPDGSGALTIRIVSITNLAFGIRMSGIKVSGAGEENPAPDPPATPDWHPSFRYFRLSQASDDLFDAYRNAYLALEAVLSDITPQKLRPNGRRESERDWLTGRRAVARAETGRAIHVAGPLVHDADEVDCCISRAVGSAVRPPRRRRARRSGGVRNRPGGTAVSRRRWGPSIRIRHAGSERHQPRQHYPL